MIKRAPRPDSGFLMIRNDVVRDSRLSYRARGLLCFMLSHPDNWEFNRDWLAAQSAGEGQTAVRTTLRELEACGYLKRQRVKLNKGRFGWEHILYDTPQPSISAGHSTGQEPTGGRPTTGNPPSQEEPKKKTVEEDVLNSPVPASVASLPQRARTEIQDQPDPLVDDHQLHAIPAQRASEDEPEFDNWRDEDRDLFKSLVGENLRSDGSRWTKGIWRADTFYREYRRTDRKRLKWPGRYLQSMLDRGNEMGVEDWMIDQGLTTVE